MKAAALSLLFVSLFYQGKWRVLPGKGKGGRACRAGRAGRRPGGSRPGMAFPPSKDAACGPVPTVPCIPEVATDFTCNLGLPVISYTPRLQAGHVAELKGQNAMGF